MTLGLSYILLGFLAGAFSGLIGVGGGVIIVPALVFLFGLSQHLAQGTTLALLVPPVGILAAWTYYTQGYVDVHIAALICVGFVIGGLVGAKVATGLADQTLERVFGVALLLIALKMIFAIGSVAERVVRAAYCPILAVRGPMQYAAIAAGQRTNPPRTAG